MPDLAAFDFDGTLTSGGSVFAFLQAVTDRGSVWSPSLALAPRLARAALVGGTVADQTKEELFQRTLGGVPLVHATQVADRFARTHLARHQRPEVRARLDRHLSRGDRVVIVSASPALYVEMAGVILGAHGVIATELAVGQDGTLTGRYEGANCRGAEKLRRLRLWIDEFGDAPDRVWAYGNSRGDLKMLGAAHVGVNVGRLGRCGALRAFPGLDATQL